MSAIVRSPCTAMNVTTQRTLYKQTAHGANVTDYQAYSKCALALGVTKVCIVADRGMISKETIEELEKEERGWQYILGARMRSQNEVKDEVLARAGRYRVVHPERQTSADPAPLKVKEVQVEGRRYIVCLNECGGSA